MACAEASGAQVIGGTATRIPRSDCATAFPRGAGQSSPPSWPAFLVVLIVLHMVSIESNSLRITV